MRALKLTWWLAFAVCVFVYVPAYYHSSKFENYVEQEAQQTTAKGQLKRMLLVQAQDYGFLLREDNINITPSDSGVRVAVDYRVPVNLYLFQHELAFHTVASGPALAR